MRALSAVGDQPGDHRADRRNLLNELFDRLDLFNRASTLRTTSKGHIDLRIDMGGNHAVGTWMSLGATRPFPLLFGDFLRVSTTEGCGLTSCLELGLIKLVTEGLILGHQIVDPLL